MLTQLAGVAVLASEGEELTELPIPWWGFGIVVFAGLALLMLVTISFSNLGNRHEAVEEVPDPNRQHANKHDHGEASTSTGH